MAKVTLSDLASGFGLAATYNANNTALEAFSDLCITGNGGNTWTVNQDMNSKRIINLADGVNPQDAATVAQLEAAGGVTTLNGLSDVTITSPSNGQYITYNSGTGQWVNTAAPTVATPALDDLSNVTCPTPSSGQILQYNGSAWVNTTNTIDNLSDVVITGVASGNVLTYNGTNWVNQTKAALGITLDDLAAVTVTSVARNDLLRYSSAAGYWLNDPAGFAGIYAQSLGGTTTTVVVAGTLYVVAGMTNLVNPTGQQVTPTSNRLTLSATGGGWYQVACGLHFNVDRACVLTVKLRKNAATDLAMEQLYFTFGAAATQNFHLSGLVNLANSDYIELFVTSDTAGTVLTVYRGNVTIHKVGI